MWSDIKVVQSAETSVKKIVFTRDDAVAETVLYKYPEYKDRTVICCSSQSGCPVGCRFCGAGDFFIRSFEGKEIVAQVDHALGMTEIDPSKIDKLQIMFMSMGEPLLNKNGMSEAIRVLHQKYPHARLLISTSAPKVDYRWINKLSVEVPAVGLQFSVHESTDARRDELIPFKNKLTLQEIAQAGQEWRAETGRKPFFNYCAADHNSTAEDADRLLALFDPRVFEATISVICERNEGLPARNEHQRELAVDFSSKLLERGYNVRVFDPAGQDDIGGGCGQLWFVQDFAQKNQHLVKKSVGAGLPEVHVPQQT